MKLRAVLAGAALLVMAASAYGQQQEWKVPKQAVPESGQVLEIPVPEQFQVPKQFQACWKGIFTPPASSLSGLNISPTDRYLRVCFREHTWTVHESLASVPGTGIDILDFGAKYFITAMDDTSLTYRAVGVDTSRGFSPAGSRILISDTFDLSTHCVLNTEFDIFSCSETGTEYWNWNWNGNQERSRPAADAFHLMKEQ